MIPLCLVIQKQKYDDTLRIFVNSRKPSTYGYKAFRVLEDPGQVVS